MTGVMVQQAAIPMRKRFRNRTTPIFYYI